MLRNPGLRKSVEQPVLDLNFAASQIGSNAAPDSRIDFSRGSNAYFVDSDGLVKKSPHNLILQSEDFGTSWTANGDVTVATNEIVAPDGTTTADKISSANFGAGANHVRQQLLLPSGTINMSVFVKDGGLGTIQLRSITLNPSTVDLSSVFTFSSESWTTLNANHTNAFVESYGNGWYRIGFDVNNPATSATGGVQMRLSAASGNGFIYLWGAQISQHTTLPVGNPYIKTTSSAIYAARLDHDPTWFMSAAQEQNLFKNSEIINDAYWGKREVTVTANTTETTDPLGGNTAEKVAETSANAARYVEANEQFSVTDGKQYTMSIYIKHISGSDRQIRLRFTGVNSAFTVSVATFDLTTQTISGNTCDDATIEDVGNGWFRCAITETATATADAVIRFDFLQSDGTVAYAGDTSVGFYLWGAQIEVGSTAGTYHRTEGQPYYGEGATPKGLLIEEQRTNLLISSNDLTGDDGTSSTVSNTQNAALGPDGTVTAAKLAANTTTPNNGRVFYPAGGITLGAGTYTYSIFLKKAEVSFVKVRIGVSGDFPGVFFNLTNGTVGTASSGFTGRIVDYGNGYFRCSITATLSAAHYFMGVHLASADNTLLSSATVGDGVFMWGHSLELGSFPTSYIETTGSSATRNADVATMGPTTGGTELVVNGTFDTDTTGWDGFGGNRSSLSVSSGQLVVDVTNANFGFVAKTDTDGGYDPVLVPGRRYRLSADLKVNSGNGVEIEIYGNGNPITSTGFVTSGTLTTKTVDFTCPDGVTSVTLFVDNKTPRATTDEYVVDNVSVRELYPFEQYNASEGTVVCEFERVGNTSFDYVWSFDDGTTSEAMSVLSLNATHVYFGHAAGGVNGLTFQAFGTVIGNDTSTGYAYQLDNTHIVLNRLDAVAIELSFTDTSIGVASVDRLGIGIRARDFVGHGNCLIKRLTYYPYRLNDDVCDSKVSSR